MLKKTLKLIKKAKTVIEARNQADAQLHNLQKDYDEVKETLTEDEKSAFESAVTAVNEATRGEDADTINQAVSKLFEAASPVFAKKTRSSTNKRISTKPNR